MDKKTMREIALDCGVTISVNKNSLDNAELLDAVVEGDEGDVRALPKITRILLSKEDKKAVYDAIREEDGRVPNEKVTEIITEIFTKLGKTDETAKN